MKLGYSIDYPSSTILQLGGQSPKQRVGDEFIDRFFNSDNAHLWSGSLGGGGRTIDEDLRIFQFGMNLDAQMYDEYCEKRGRNSTDATECLRLWKAHCLNYITALSKKIMRDHGA